MPEPVAPAAAGRRHLPRWLAAAGAVLLGVGLVAWWTATPTPTGDDHPGAALAGSERRSPTTAPAPRPLVARPEPGSPRLVRIPALRVSAPVVPVRAPGGTLVPPSDPQQLGWWSDGAKPGAARGSALVTGHTVHTGGGALDDLEELRPGDRVVVRTDRSSLRYVVQQVRTYSKGAIARHADRLFSQQVAGRLVLVTCEDWDGERYLSNVVVTATPHA